jgi:tetratricopeptide (TPR) repeat protein
LEEAQKFCEKAIELNQKNDKFWFNMGKIMQGLNRHRQAEICFKKATELGS